MVNRAGVQNPANDGADEPVDLGQRVGSPTGIALPTFSPTTALA